MVIMVLIIIKRKIQKFIQKPLKLVDCQSKSKSSVII